MFRFLPFTTDAVYGELSSSCFGPRAQNPEQASLAIGTVGAPKRRSACGLKLKLGIAAVGLLCTVPAVAVSNPSELEAKALPLLKEYCYDCHGEGSKKGGVALDKSLSAADAQKLWFSVWRNVDAELMPPSDKPRPNPEERALLRQWLELGALKLDPANPDPGRVTVRRMNREEYRNSIFDLTGVTFAAQDRFPADDTGYGFDTIGEVLNLSPIHIEKYFGAAQEIATKALLAESSLRKPLFPEGPPPPDPNANAAYVRGLLRDFAQRALRRPVDEVTLGRLCSIASLEDSFESGIRQAMTAVLSSPSFLFRAEHQAEPNNAGSIVPLDEWALASRLSYFLWSSTPDAELLQLAGKGQLRAQLSAQVRRMLMDSKGERFAQNFVGQWLQTRDVEEVPIQARVILGAKNQEEAEKRFPHRLRSSMRRETELLFQHILRENLPAEELFTAQYSFLNAPLAAFYGIGNVKGKEFQKVPLPEFTHRQGILTQGGFLLVSSNPTRTSPVKRGLFVLENLLGTPAPPPPPDIPPLEAVKKGDKLSMRALMEFHRKEALCASCHARMDPIGLALENFNALGQFRDTVAGSPIDSAGQLITGEKFNNVPELIRILSTSRKHDFYRCLSEKMLTYAIGRGLEPGDIPAINQLVAVLETQNGRLATLVEAIVQSVPFQKRRGAGERVATVPFQR